MLHVVSAHAPWGRATWWCRHDSKIQAQQLQQYAIQTSKNLPFWMFECLGWCLLGNHSQILIQNQKILVRSENMDERYKPSIFGMRTYVSSSDIWPSPTHRTISCCTVSQTLKLAGYMTHPLRMTERIASQYMVTIQQSHSQHEHHYTKSLTTLTQ